MKITTIFRNLTVFVCLLVATLSNLSAQTRTTFTFVQAGANEHAVDIPNVKNPNNDGALVFPDVMRMIRTQGVGDGDAGQTARYLSNPQNDGAGNWQRQTSGGVWTNIAEDSRLIKIFTTDRIRFLPTVGGEGSVVTLDFYAVRVPNAVTLADSYADFAAARTASSVLQRSADNDHNGRGLCSYAGYSVS